MNEIIHKIKGYAGHKTPVSINDLYFYPPNPTLDDCLGLLTFNQIVNLFEKGDAKLILRSLESLTDEEIDIAIENEGFMSKYNINSQNRKNQNTLGYIKLYLMEGILTIETLEYFHKNHIDYQDLIGQGLAVEKEEE